MCEQAKLLQAARYCSKKCMLVDARAHVMVCGKPATKWTFGAAEKKAEADALSGGVAKSSSSSGNRRK
jgi:hypothetical protein